MEQENTEQLTEQNREQNTEQLTEQNTDQSVSGGDDLVLKWDIIEEQQGTVSTLGEQYGYDVFSEEFTEGVERVQAEEKQEEEACFERIFEEEPADKTEEAFAAVFSAQMQTVVKVDYGLEGQEEASPWFAAGFTAAGMFLAGCILFWVEKWRKERGHAADNHSHGA